MTASEMRGLEPGELEKKVKELQRTIFDMRMKLRTGHLDSTAEMDRTKKDLARALTLLRERDLGIRRESK